MTFCTPSKRATSLRYAPKKNQMGILLNWSERYHVVGGLSMASPMLKRRNVLKDTTQIQ